MYRFKAMNIRNLFLYDVKTRTGDGMHSTDGTRMINL